MSPSDVAPGLFQALWRTSEGRLRLAKLCAVVVRRYSYHSPYPPIPVWEPKTLADVHRAWESLAAQRKEDRGPLGLYVHVPFCSTKCTFCNCMSVTDRRSASHEAYLDCLEREIDWLAFPRSLRVETICIGGGTPTILSAKLLGRLFSLLERSFDLSACREKMVETSPFPVSPAAARALSAWDVSRVTLGVQTTEPALLTRFHRPQDSAMVRETFASLRRCGIRHISADLLAGLPGQTLRSFRESLDFVLSLKPDSISTYPFACLDTTPFQVQGGRIRAQDVAVRERMLALASKVLSRHYPERVRKIGRGVDSRQRVDRDYRNGSILGLGYSSRSYAKGHLSYVKASSFGRYVEAFQQGRFPPIRGWSLNRDEFMRSFVVDRLEMEGRIARTGFQELFHQGIDRVFPKELSLALAQGLIEDRGEDLVVRDDPRNHERRRLICGKLFFSRKALSAVWELAARGGSREPLGGRVG